MLRTFLLICGILSSLLYAAMNVIVPMGDAGYSWARQTVSELSAIGAPTRPLWVFWATIYGLLVIAFGWGIGLSAGRRRSLRFVSGLMIASAALGFSWPPMHLRETLAQGGGSISDTLHIVWTVAWSVLALLMMGFAAVAFGRRFRRYSFITVIIVLVFGALTGLDSPGIQANLPTPWIGVWERISIGAFMLWVAVLAIALLRAQTTMRFTHSGASRDEGLASVT